MEQKQKKEKTAEKNIHKNHRSRVREKFIKNGLVPFDEHEILEFLLFYSIPQANTNPIAHKLIDEFGSLKSVLDASPDRLGSVKGVGERTATLINLVSGIVHAYNKLSAGEMKTISNQEMAKEYVSKVLTGLTEECLFVICLSPKCEILGTKELKSNSTSFIDVQIRDITNFALKHNCNRIILAHNHPLGTAEPSNDDLYMTKRIFSSSVLNDIDIIDHIIYADNDIYSFAEDGKMKEIKEEVLNALKYSLSKDQVKRFSTSTQEYIIKR